jgi:hypothetical protein
MSCLSWIISGVRRRHRLISISTFCIVLVASGASSIQAQDSDPSDLQMLLNLDLFRPQPQQDEPGAGSSDSNGSMLDEIRALNALGYLGDSSGTGAAVGDGASGSTEPPAPPPSQETPQ